MNKTVAVYTVCSVIITPYQKAKHSAEKSTGFKLPVLISEEMTIRTKIIVLTEELVNFFS